ncbi:MAG: insulinase family protein, partial [Rhodobacteraceae bacterium]|nr:insulinase family protein [Paracoccaceae bacterium]
ALGLVVASPALADREKFSTTLDNGLRVVVIPDNRAPVVTHMIWYRVGAADEPPGVSGIAHFVEHLMFKGTEAVGPGEFSRIVRENGGRDNAFVSWDYTAFFQRVATDRLEMMMEMEADRMTGLTFDPLEVATEHDVILEERAQVVESRPDAVFGELRRAALFKNHPYGRPIIGWRHEMEAFGRAEAIAFYRAHYAPDNAVVVVAGDVVPEDVFDMAARIYGGIPSRPSAIPGPRPTEPPHLAERRLAFEDERVSQPYVIRTYLAPSRRTGDQREAAALTMLAEILGGSGVTSVMGRTLQLERQVALSASAFHDGINRDHGTFTLYAVPADGVSLAEVEQAMDEVVAQFLDEGVDAEQLARVHTRIRASRIFAMDDTDRLARRVGEALSVGLGLDDIAEWPELLESVTPEEIVAAGRAVLDRRRAVTGWISGPDDQSEDS